MRETIQTYWESTDAEALHAALAALGWDAEAGTGSVPTDPRVAAFGPVTTETVAGVDIAFALLVLTDHVGAPAGVSVGAGGASRGAVGVMMQGPQKPTPRAWLDSVLSMERQAEVFGAAQGTPLAFVLFRLGMAIDIDVALPETVQGVSALRAAGLISAGEAEALLA